MNAATCPPELPPERPLTPGEALMTLFLDNADRGANHANDELVAALLQRARDIRALADHPDTRTAGEDDVLTGGSWAMVSPTVGGGPELVNGSPGQLASKAAGARSVRLPTSSVEPFPRDWTILPLDRARLPVRSPGQHLHPLLRRWPVVDRMRRTGGCA